MVRVRYSFGSRHTGKLENIRKQRSKYPDLAKEVIRISDIILEVIDCRFIEDTRNKEVEEEIKKLGKRIIYVFNKTDLVESKKLEKKISPDLKPYVFVSVKESSSLNKLRDKIKIEAKRVRTKDRRRVHVGIIGYPNVGKSSLINAITRRGAAWVSKQAGYTKGLQKIKLVEDILIIDTPGVIPESKYSSDAKMRHSEDTKVGARTYSNVKNPEDVVHFLMKENSKRMDKFYGVEAFGDVEVLIEKLGKKKNFLKKGGEIDIDRTARLILRDWQEGKIKS